MACRHRVRMAATRHVSLCLSCCRPHAEGMSATMPDCESMSVSTMDTEQPNLCKAHCDNDKQRVKASDHSVEVPAGCRARSRVDLASSVATPSRRRGSPIRSTPVGPWHAPAVHHLPRPSQLARQLARPWRAGLPAYRFRKDEPCVHLMRAAISWRRILGWTVSWPGAAGAGRRVVAELRAGAATGRRTVGLAEGASRGERTGPPRCNSAPRNCPTRG